MGPFGPEQAGIGLAGNSAGFRGQVVRQYRGIEFVAFPNAPGKHLVKAASDRDRIIALSGCKAQPHLVHLAGFQPERIVECCLGARRLRIHGVGTSFDEVSVGGGRIEVVVNLFDVFAMIAFRPGQVEQPFF